MNYDIEPLNNVLPVVRYNSRFLHVCKAVNMISAAELFTYLRNYRALKNAEMNERMIG